MKYGELQGARLPISRLVIGSMVCSTDSMNETRALLDAWVAAGGNAIDTARVYAGGKSESAVGEWMQERGNRDQLFIIGKGAHPDAHGPRVNARGISEDIAETLRRLQTDAIDLYLLHRDDPSVPVGEIVEVLNEHHAAGRIRAFGGSNWTTARIEEANAYARAHNLVGFSASSPQCCLAAVNEPMWGGCVVLDPAGIQWHTENAFPLFPWSAQASGFFTGRYAPEPRPGGDIERVYYNEPNWERLRRACAVGERHGVSANNIALAWVLGLPLPVFPLFGPRTVAELHESLKALDVRLSPQERSYLNLESD